MNDDSWTKISFFSLPRTLKKEGATPESFVEEDLDDPDGLLEKDDVKEKVIAAITNASASGGAKKKKVKTEGVYDNNPFIARIKRNVEAHTKEDEDEPPSKRLKLAEQKEVKLFEQFNKMTIDELKDFMRYVF